MSLSPFFASHQLVENVCIHCVDTEAPTYKAFRFFALDLQIEFSLKHGESCRFALPEEWDIVRQIREQVAVVGPDVTICCARLRTAQSQSETCGFVYPLLLVVCPLTPLQKGRQCPVLRSFPVYPRDRARRSKRNSYSSVSRVLRRSQRGTDMFPSTTQI